MFTYKNFERRSPEIKMILHYHEESTEIEQPYEVITTVSIVNIGNQYEVSTEMKNFSTNNDETINQHYFKLYMNDIQKVFEYVYLFFLKKQLFVEYSLLSPRFYTEDTGKSYVLLKDQDLGESQERMEDRLHRYLKMMSGVTVTECGSDII